MSSRLTSSRAAGQAGGARSDPVRTGSAAGPDGALRRDVRAGPAQRRPHLRRWDSRSTTSPRPIRPWRDRRARRGPAGRHVRPDAGVRRAAMLMLPFFNYAEGNHDAIYEMLSHPAAVSGLSDGGAHCGMICDASFPTYLLTHWARDRHRGPKLLPRVRGAEADTGHCNAFRPLRPRDDLRGQEGRPQRHRLRRAEPRVAPHGLRPARRRPPAPPGRRAATSPPWSAARSPAARRRHRRPPGPVDSGRPLTGRRAGHPVSSVAGP